LKIAVLTSSRADYSILSPLLSKLKKDKFFDLNIIAFGSHLSVKHGETINLIRKDGFKVTHSFNTNSISDTPSAISKSIAKTILNFTRIWETYKFDLVIAIGDRYEMFAACTSIIPFNIPIAHIHGGETTKGAFDDCFRHSITQMSNIHFTATEKYKNRVIELKGDKKNVHNVGALSIDNLKSLKLYTKKEFKKIFNIDISIPSILITFQPETVNFQLNKQYIKSIIDALKEIKEFQLIITMPNADTMGNYVRKELEKFIQNTKNAVKIESFGTIGYLTCMKYCSMLLGNTSSGFIEASFFPKYVINLGKRQQGRIITSNINTIKISKNGILKAVRDFKNFKDQQYNGIYGNGQAAKDIISILKNSDK
jgi:GDP/UDP-N,N'-diacetylbacillosamine 2-epimerase (hydrolysing)